MYADEMTMQGVARLSLIAARTRSHAARRWARAGSASDRDDPDVQAAAVEHRRLGLE